MRLKMINSSEYFDSSKIIDDHHILGKLDKATNKKTYTPGGLFSPNIFTDIDINNEEYSCECGNMRGKFYNGATCPKCGKTVEWVGRSIDRMGWIDLSGNKYDEKGNITEKGNNYKIIKYVHYGFLEKIFTPQVLEMIWRTPDIIDEDGEIDEEAVQAKRDEAPENKYFYIGLEKFYENYDEILSYYADLNLTPEDENRKYLLYVKFRDDVFTDKIPVISSMLRPAKRDGDALKLDEINNIYINIIKLNNAINNNDIQIPLLTSSRLTMIQSKYFNLIEYIITILTGKKGVIRNNMCGTRINFSARNIITPAFVGRKIDEIVLPYQTMLELYKYEIINILRQVKGCQLPDAQNIHARAKIKFDQEVYDIMKKMIKESEVGVLLNRNPTINFGSILYLTVCDVKKDIDDFTMSINNIYTEPLAADYDGDVLNIISVKDARAKAKFKEIFSPKSMLVSAKNGHFNDSLSLKKDQLLGLNILNGY